MKLRKSIVMGMLFVMLVSMFTLVAAAEENYEFTMVIYGTTGNPFWQKVVAGAEETAENYDISLDVQYADNDPEKQNNIIETALANEVDGLGIIINLDDAYDETVKKAMDSGTPVIAYNIDDTKGREGNARMAFIGQDFVTAGYLITRRLIETYDIGEGDHVVTPVEHPEAVYAQKRYEGAKKALDEVGASSEILETGAISPEDTLTKIVQYFLGHPDTDAVVALGQMPMEMTPQAISEAGMDIPNVGFDVSKKIIRNILSGKSLATVDQQPFYQGAFTVMQLYYNNKYGLLPCNINTGGAIIDKSNAKKVLELADTVR